MGMRAWDTVWGHGTAKVVIENSYAIVSDSVITDGTSEIKTRRNVLSRISAPRPWGGNQRACVHHSTSAQGSQSRVRVR